LARVKKLAHQLDDQLGGETDPLPPVVKEESAS